MGPGGADLFEVELRRDGAACVVTPVGEVDIATARRLGDSLRMVVEEGDAGPVVIDLAEVSFMDSTGLKILLNAHRRLTRAGRALALAAAPPQIRRLLEIARLDQTFDVYDSTDAAIARLTS